MTKTTVGWSIFVAALGMMCGLLAVDISALSTWDQALKPVFVGTFIGHVSVVIGAFIGGKLIPPDRDTTQRTRVTDVATNNPHQ